MPGSTREAQSLEKDHRSTGEQHKGFPATPDSKLASSRPAAMGTHSAWGTKKSERQLMSTGLWSYQLHGDVVEHLLWPECWNGWIHTLQEGRGRQGGRVTLYVSDQQGIGSQPGDGWGADLCHTVIAKIYGGSHHSIGKKISNLQDRKTTETCTRVKIKEISAVHGTTC